MRSQSLKSTLRGAASLGAIALGLALAACGAGGGGGGGGNGTTTPSDNVPNITGTDYVFHFDGPGGAPIEDRMTLGSNAFVSTMSNGASYWGTVAKLPNGFLNLTVTHSQDVSISPLGAYPALEIPGTVLATFAPSGSGVFTWQATIGLAAGGTCPASAGSANFVENPGASFTVGSDSIGYVDYLGGGSDLDFNTVWAVRLQDGVTDASKPPVLDMPCSNGQFTLPGVADFQTTPSGFWLGEKLAIDGGALFMLPKTGIGPDTVTGALYLGWSVRSVETTPGGKMMDAVDAIWARGTGPAIEAGHLASFTDPLPAAGTGLAVTVGRWSNGEALMETVADPSCSGGQCDFRFITAPIGGKHMVIGMQMGFMAGPPEPEWHNIVLFEQ